MSRPHVVYRQKPSRRDRHAARRGATRNPGAPGRAARPRHPSVEVGPEAAAVEVPPHPLFVVVVQAACLLALRARPTRRLLVDREHVHSMRLHVEFNGVLVPFEGLAPGREAGCPDACSGKLPSVSRVSQDLPSNVPRHDFSEVVLQRDNEVSRSIEKTCALVAASKDEPQFLDPLRLNDLCRQVAQRRQLAWRIKAIGRRDPYRLIRLENDDAAIFLGVVGFNANFGVAYRNGRQRCRMGVALMLITRPPGSTSAAVGG